AAGFTFRQPCFRQLEHERLQQSRVYFTGMDRRKPAAAVLSNHEPGASGAGVGDGKPLARRQLLGAVHEEKTGSLYRCDLVESSLLLRERMLGAKRKCLGMK